MAPAFEVVAAALVGVERRNEGDFGVAVRGAFGIEDPAADGDSRGHRVGERSRDQGCDDEADVGHPLFLLEVSCFLLRRMIPAWLCCQSEVGNT